MYIPVNKSMMSTWINNRRLYIDGLTGKGNLPVKLIMKEMGWPGYNDKTCDNSMYYYRIGEDARAWRLTELCKLLHLFRCTYEELFMYKPFSNESMDYLYVDNRKCAEEITEMLNNKGLKREELLNLLSITRQGFNSFLTRKKIRITQINTILTYLDCNFDDVFVTRIKNDE